MANKKLRWKGKSILRKIFSIEGPIQKKIHFCHKNRFKHTPATTFIKCIHAIAGSYEVIPNRFSFSFLILLCQGLLNNIEIFHFYDIHETICFTIFPWNHKLNLAEFQIVSVGGIVSFTIQYQRQCLCYGVEMPNISELRGDVMKT